MITRHVKLREGITLVEAEAASFAARHAGLGGWLHQGHLVLAGPNATVIAFLAALAQMGPTAVVKPGASA